MGKYFDMLMEDVRMQEGLTACMTTVPSPESASYAMPS